MTRTHKPHNAKPRIFMSYAKEDAQRVRPLFTEFTRAGFDPWMDIEALKPGQDWKREIQKAIKNADFVVVFLSHTSIRKRGYVQAEIKFTLEVLAEIPDEHVFAIPT